MSLSHTPEPTDASSTRAEDVAATFCATLVDEWIHHGVLHAVIAPGSRSTPLALALAARTELQLHLFHDERSASFAAIGVGLATGLPAVLLCTSGTAAAHFHAAVVEAHQAAVPMLVCTADRPPELRDVGAPQTIDQTKLYGASVRWFHDPGVASVEAAHTWRSTAAHAFATSVGVWPGPVHLNLPFREPLVGVAGELPARRGTGSAATRCTISPDLAAVADLAQRVAGHQGVIIAGRGCGDPWVLADLARQLGWPVLADVRSGLRAEVPGRPRDAVTAFDEILRSSEFTSAHVPEVVLRFGEPPASKVLGQWLARLGADQVHITGVPTWTDPDGVIDLHITADPTALCTALAADLASGDKASIDVRWAADWLAAEQLAQAAIDAALGTALSEPAVARLLARSLPHPSNLVISSSMPIRDVEWYADTVGGATVYSNRGTNGIDGVIATATGVALATGEPTFLLIGDVAFLHDSSSLTALARRRADLRIVLVDNDGGGIFSFLPQAGTLPAERFEQLFGTPHGTDVAALAAAHSLRVATPDNRAGFAAALTAEGPLVIVVRSERGANVTEHDELHRAVAAALSGREPS